MKSLGLILLACYLTVAVMGCSIRQTGQGMAFDSHWSLRCSHRVPWIAVQSTKTSDDNNVTSSDRNIESAKHSAISDGQSSDKPEVLPWRNRMKGYRLGSRIFRGKDSSSETAAVSSTEKTPLISPAGLIVLPEDSPKASSVISASKASQRNASATVAEFWEPTKPDPVVE